MITDKQLRDFVIESNSIEKIFREPLPQELVELDRFIKLPKITIEELQKFVSIYQPDAQLRDQYGMNVRIGKYIPEFGGPDIRIKLIEILDNNYNPFELHVRYEQLHPFMDGNGRSGRALWLWKRQTLQHSFLMDYYFDTLSFTKYGNL